LARKGMIYAPSATPRRLLLGQMTALDDHGRTKVYPCHILFTTHRVFSGAQGCQFWCSFACDVGLADYELRLRRATTTDIRMPACMFWDAGRMKRLNFDEDDQACLFYGVGPILRMTALGSPYSQADHEKN